MVEVFIAIGANLGNPCYQARQAVAALAALPDTTLLQSSSFYRSSPMGPADQPDYVNAVVRLRTELAPLVLLDHLQQIETEHGRVRSGTRWGARTLDLDLLLYGKEQIADERLVVPHYGMKERDFVLLPLAEIVPDYVLPCGTAISELIAHCSNNNLTVIAFDAA